MQRYPDDWEKRDESVLALHDAVQAAIDGAATTPLPSLDDWREMGRILREPFKKLVADLRSELVRDACACLDAMASCAGDSLRQLLRDILPAMVGVLATGNKVIRGYMAECIDSVLRQVRYRGAVPLVRDIILTSRSKQQRESCARYLLVFLDAWGPFSMRDQSTVDALGAAIVEGLSDASEDVRETSRVAFISFYRAANPKKSAQLMAAMDPRALSKLQQALADAGVEPGSGEAGGGGPGGGGAVSAAAPPTRRPPAGRAPRRPRSGPGPGAGAGPGPGRGAGPGRAPAASEAAAAGRRRPRHAAAAEGEGKEPAGPAGPAGPAAAEDPPSPAAAPSAPAAVARQLFGGDVDREAEKAFSFIASPIPEAVLRGSPVPPEGGAFEPEKGGMSAAEAEAERLALGVAEGDAVRVKSLPAPNGATVRFVGLTSFATGLWVGVELDGGGGKNDGEVAGHRYFSCPPGRGLFVRPRNVEPASEAPRGRSAGAEADGALRVRRDARRCVEFCRIFAGEMLLQAKAIIDAAEGCGGALGGEGDAGEELKAVVEALADVARQRGAERILELVDGMESGEEDLPGIEQLRQSCR